MKDQEKKGMEKKQKMAVPNIPVPAEDW